MRTSCSSISGRICLISLLAVALYAPRGAVAQSSDGSASPANAAAVVVGERAGQEVDRWAGALAWDGPIPIELVARKQDNQWSWQPHEPEELRIQASLDPPRDGVVIPVTSA